MEDGLKSQVISKALAHARMLVGRFSHSTKAVEALKKQQEKMGEINSLLLIQDVQTRWNSQFLLISPLLKLRLPVLAILIDPEATKTSDRATLDLPDFSWKVLEDILPVLELWLRQLSYLL